MSPQRVAALLLCIFVAQRAAGAVADYAYAWPLRVDGDSAAWQLELTPEVYAVLGHDDLRDLEVVNAAGESVALAPYRPPAANTAHDAIIDLPLFALPASAGQRADDATIQLQVERAADGKLRRLSADVGNAAPATRGDVLLDASAVHDPLTALRLDWSGDASVSARFALAASDDLQHWHDLAGDATVLRLRQEGNVLERHEVALNGAHASYLRLRRLDQGAALPDLKAGVRVVTASTPALPARLWQAAILDGSDTRYIDKRPAPGDGTHPIAFRYHLPAALPASALKLELADDNSVAAGSVLGTDRAGTNPVWSQRATFVAFRLHQGDTSVGNDELARAQGSARTRDWRIELNTALERAPALSVAYRPDRFVFLTQGAGPYRLVAGSARARRGDYPVDAALASLRARLGADWQPPLTTLGARELLSGDSALVAKPATTPVRNWKQWLLWAVLLAAVAVVSGLALSLLRKR